jgi:phosphoglycerate dehydrogenase-like enzyme
MMRESGAWDNRDVRLCGPVRICGRSDLSGGCSSHSRSFERAQAEAIEYLQISRRGEGVPPGEGTSETCGVYIVTPQPRSHEEKEMPRITLINNPMHDLEILRQLTPAGLDVTVVERHGDNFSKVLRDTAYLVGYADKEMDDAFYENAQSLKLIQLISAGYDRVNIEAAHRAGVAVCNNGGANSGPVAEHAIMFVLALARQLLRQHEEVVTARWKRSAISKEVFTLEGRTIGIVGLGTIGRKTARLARGFGMNVQYYDIQRLSEDAEAQLGARFRLLDEILGTSDFVSAHVPLTSRTLRMFGKDQFSRMKPSAFFVNTARGEIVDECALVEALTNGTIAGAGLDVFEQEPSPSDNPLFKQKNVVLSPHLAGPIWDTQYQKFRNAFDNIQRVDRGEHPLWLIPELATCKLRISTSLVLPSRE